MHSWTTNRSKEKSERKLKRNLETNKNGSTVYRNVWDATKTVLKGKFIMLITCIKKKSLKQPNFISEGTRKKMNKVQSKQKLGNNRLEQK